jgi:hypothetical protein
MTTAVIRKRNPNAPDESRNVGVILLSEADNAPEGESPEVRVDVYVANLGALFPSATGEQLSELERVLADTKRAALRLSGLHQPQEQVLRRIQHSASSVSILMLGQSSRPAESEAERRCLEHAHLEQAVLLCISPEGRVAPSEE